MQIIFVRRKPLKYVSPNSIYIYQPISSDKFSKKLVNKPISMNEYFMLKCLCQKWCHESFAIYFHELEADKNVAVIIIEARFIILRTIWYCNVHGIYI